MKSVRLLIGIILVLACSILFVPTSRGQEGIDPPDPGSGVITEFQKFKNDSCGMKLRGDSIVNTFEADGKKISLEYKKKTVRLKPGTRFTNVTLYFAEELLGGLFLVGHNGLSESVLINEVEELYQFQDGQAVRAPAEYYLFLRDKLTGNPFVGADEFEVFSYRAGQDAGSDNNESGAHGGVVKNPAGASNYLYIDNFDIGIRYAGFPGPYISPDGTVVKSGHPFFAYMTWLQSGYSGCKPFSDEFSAINQKGKDGNDHTVALLEKTSNTKLYYVGFTNINGETKCTGFMYRNGGRYLMVGDRNSKKVFCRYDQSKTHDWDDTESKGPELTAPIVEGFLDPPKPSNPIYVNPVYADFSKAREGELTVDDVQSGKEMTFETNFNEPFGPPMVKEHIGMNDARTTTIPEAGINNETFILAHNELKDLYGSGSVVPADHASQLATKLTVCAHKNIETKNVILAGKTDLTIADSSGFINSGAPGIKQNGIKWVPKDNPLKIEAKTGPQPCGGTEDKDLIDRGTQPLEDAAAAAGKGLQSIILQALQGLAKLIQNFIIYVVKWMIEVATSYVPI